MSTLVQLSSLLFNAVGCSDTIRPFLDHWIALRSDEKSREPYPTYLTNAPDNCLSVARTKHTVGDLNPEMLGPGYSAAVDIVGKRIVLA